MKRLILITTTLLAIAACGSEDEQTDFYGNGKGKDPQPLAENTPLGADDIDAIVAAEREKSNPSQATPATQQENTNGN